jgi:hypothetical protein
MRLMRRHFRVGTTCRGGSSAIGEPSDASGSIFFQESADRSPQITPIPHVAVISRGDALWVILVFCQPDYPADRYSSQRNSQRMGDYR